MKLIINKINDSFNTCTNVFLVINVLVVIVLALVSILCRWMQWTNMWIDPLNRHLVLLIIFLGSTVAIDKKKHLKIDALTMSLEHKLGKVALHTLELLLILLTGIVIYFLFLSGLKFWQTELEFPVDAFLGLKQYHLAIIIPFGFFMMLIKYFLSFAVHLSNFNKDAHT